MAGAKDIAITATAYELIRQPSAATTLDICIGRLAPGLEEMAAAFIAWAIAYPSAGNWDEADGMVAAFRAKWPCGSISH